MTSTLIIEPKNEQTLKAHKNFTVLIKVKNLKTGDFSDPEHKYYSIPQELDDGIIKGHTHITVQHLGNEKNVPDAKVFGFFEGLNFRAKNNILKVEVDGSKLFAGKYRICTMSSSFSHQPLVMPVAKRGAQDDCIRVTLTNHHKHHKRTPRRPRNWKV
ncbi:43280_t:CDS:1 [Gigaspora margarita]|uniref:43280_t:CDS:1 n=1 Tax=Gigaspora margarita TaxID=4874 RepID=A0ABN7UH11_GIGMA|nr:43280_t:CDS:1 [Gigaspora margarita]